MRIINFHDLNEEKENRYYKELLKYFPEEQIDSVEYDLTDNPAELLMEWAAGVWVDRPEESYDLIVGCGFGAVLALLFSRIKDDRIRTILINPMYPLSRYIPEEAPDYEYAEMLQETTEEVICRCKGILKNVYLVLGKDDDITDTARTPAYFRRVNVYFVEGGHFPEGEEFSECFAKLAGIPVPDVKVTSGATGKETEDEAFIELKKFAEDEKGNFAPFFYAHSYKYQKLSEIARTLVKYMQNEHAEKEVRYISADEFAPSDEKLRAEYRGVDLLIIDNVRKSLLTDKIEISLWTVCNELVLHGGKVLMLSNDDVSEIFSDNADILEMVYNGRIGLIGNGLEKTSKGGVTWLESKNMRPLSDYYKNMTIDDIETEHGNFTFHFHTPLRGKDSIYLYYSGGKWYADEHDGVSVEPELVAEVLKNAAGKFAETIECVERIGEDGWTLVW